MKVVSVFGPFQSQALVEMSAEQATKLVDGPLAAAAPSRTVDAMEREVERIRTRDEQLADSPLAASAVALAYEIDNPFNSATSKSMCAKELREVVDRLRALSPPEVKKDGIDQLAQRRADRLAARSAAT